MKKFGSLILLYIFCTTNVFTKECRSPLGMEDGRIKDSRITTTSYFNKAYGKLARLTKNISKCGAWCPNTCGIATDKKLKYDQHIIIELEDLKKITAIATQARCCTDNGRKDWMKHYKLSYRSEDDGNWVFYKGKDGSVKIFDGNTNACTVKRHLVPAILTRKIRVHPGYYTGQNVCMRLELYGSIPTKVKDRSKQTPTKDWTYPGNICGVSQSSTASSPSRLVTVSPTSRCEVILSKNGKVHYNDTSYTGILIKHVCEDGTGILTDVKFRPVNAKELNSNGWIGWSSNSTKSQYIDITFEFSGVRKFKDVSLILNVDRQRKQAVFNRSQIYFSTLEDRFSNTSCLQRYPRNFSYNDNPYNATVNLSLCENTGKFIKLRLYFGGKRLLITEISFNSVHVDGNKQTRIKKCHDVHACAVTQQSSTSLPSVFSPTSACEDCPRKTPDSLTETTGNSEKRPVGSLPVHDSSNPQPTIICVILFVFILLLVLMFLLYRRRALCFGKVKKRKMTDNNVHVELQDVESYEEQEYEEPHYFPCEGEIEPYEVDLLPPSVYTELSREQEDGTAYHNYQKLLKYESDYVIPAEDHVESLYEEIGQTKSSSGYTELGNTKALYRRASFP